MIIWNGVSSDSIGVIVERIPNRQITARRFTPQKIPGRNGDWLQVDESHDNTEQVYEVYLSAEAVGLPRVAHACAAWLNGPRGYAILRDDYDPSGFRYAFLRQAVNIENVLNLFGRTEIVFSCMPQLFLDAGQTEIDITAMSEIINETQNDAEPLLRVVGTGDLTINGRTISILENASEMTIDCQEAEATIGGENANTSVYCLEYPVLSPGSNAITIGEGITSVMMIPRWWVQ